MAVPFTPGTVLVFYLANRWLADVGLPSADYNRGGSCAGGRSAWQWFYASGISTLQHQPRHQHLYLAACNSFHFSEILGIDWSCFNYLTVDLNG